MQPNQPQYNQQQPVQPIYPVPMQGPLAPAPPPAYRGGHKPVGLIGGLVVAVLLLLGALGFAGWAFMGMQDYKTNSDQKAAVAVTAAKEAQAKTLQAEFDEKEKNPLTKYTGPGNYGTLTITYPKTWSAFVTEVNAASSPVDGYLHPGFVPGLQSGTAYALRFQVLNTSYAAELKKYEAGAKTGKLKISPYKLPKVPDLTGSRVDGQIAINQQGSIVLMPLRDKTIVITTQAPQFVADFNNIILPNLTFVP